MKVHFLRLLRLIIFASSHDQRERVKKMRGKPVKSNKDWILEKKERRRRKGKDTRPDTKYTGRKRSGKLW